MFDRFYPTMSWSEHQPHWPQAQHSQFVKAGGIQWHVQSCGQGPGLLLLHGTGSGSFSWRGLMPLLSPYFQVVAPDLPGHAFTDRGSRQGQAQPKAKTQPQLQPQLQPLSLSLDGMTEGVRALLLQLNWQPQVIVGHSAGAAIAANLVLKQRLHAVHLIGLNPAWLPLPGVAPWVFKPLAKLAALNPLSAWTTAKLSAQPEVMAKLIKQTGSKIDAEGLALYKKVFSHSGHVHSVLQMMEAWNLNPLANAISSLKNRTTLLVGSNDKTVPPKLADEFCRRVQQAELMVQSGLGHLAHEEDPVGTATLLLRALALGRL